MSVKVEFRLVNLGRVEKSMVKDFDTVALADMARDEGMDVFDNKNPDAKWVDMRIDNNG